MFNTYDEASKYSVGDQRPEALGWGQWRPGGYTQMGNQWVRPNDAPPMGPNQSAIATSLGSPDRTTGQGIDESGGWMPGPDTRFNEFGYKTNPDTTKAQSGGASVAAMQGGGGDGRWDAGLKAQMDAIGAKNGRTWRDDEYEQWIGKNGYIMKDDIDGSGKSLGAWKGGDIDPYWQSRMGMHATGDYYGNGTTPGDANSNRASGGGNANQSMAAQAQNSLDPLMGGDPIARIMAALGKVNGNGQVNLDALLNQLQGV